MLEQMSTVLSRIQDIKAQFRQDYSGGVVSVVPSGSAGPTKKCVSEIQPFFPDYLKSMALKKTSESASTGSTSYDDLIKTAADKNGLDPALLKGLIQAESGFNAKAVSGAGAEGLTQLMPSTAAALGVSDSFDPAQSINAGARYLKLQMDRFGDVDKALAAYNAGPAAVAKYNGVPPYRETRGYVNKVLSLRDKYSSDGG